MKRIQALVGGPEKYETRRRKRRRGMSRKGVHRAASTDPFGEKLPLTLSPWLKLGETAIGSFRWCHPVMCVYVVRLAEEPKGITSLVMSSTFGSTKLVGYSVDLFLSIRSPSALLGIQGCV